MLADEGKYKPDRFPLYLGAWNVTNNGKDTKGTRRRPSPTSIRSSSTWPSTSPAPSRSSSV